MTRVMPEGALRNLFSVDKRLNYGRHLIEQFLKTAGPYSSVLDVGAGRGMDLEIARSIRPEARLSAIETHPGCRNDLGKSGIDAVNIDIERDFFPFDDESFDVVIANQIPEHCKEVFWILHNISRVLSPGGALIIGVPNLGSLHNRMLLMLGRQPTVIKNSSAHVRGFTMGDLLSLLECGFHGGYRLQASGGSNFYPFPPSLAGPLARWFPSAAWGMFLLVRKSRSYHRGYIDYLETVDLETNFFKGPA